MIAVELDRIAKSYAKGKVQAVRSVSFDVHKGELFGLIGPDGAGKTSIFRMLTTLLIPDAGKATVDGFDIVKDYKAIRKRVGYMPGRFSLYQDLSVQENLEFFATLFDTTIDANYEMIRDIYAQIERFKNRKAGKLSGGMKQKLALCCALIHKPSVLFLDEPTTGVDAVSRKEFWEMLRSLRAQNITILVSTPYMDEATLCDRIALIQEGQILSIDTPQGIIQSFGSPLLAVKSEQMISLLHHLRNYSGTKTCYTFGEFHHLTLKETEEVSDLKTYLKSKGQVGVEIQSVQPTIEDCFMAQMNRRADQNENYG